jgi:hypothetical protein
MGRHLVIAAAQMGPIARTESRVAVVRRMIDLMRQAKALGAEVVAYPEATLTAFFPHWFTEDEDEVDAWFERDMPGPQTQPLFDEARRLGLQLGLPERIVWRHPFPGPGLAVRCLGHVTRTRLDTLREADAIVLEELDRAGLMRKVSQAFAVLLPVQSVGVMGDARTYDEVLAVRAVETEDFMTADWTRLPHELLAKVSTRIINEVRGVNRVAYDISSKPPATIEWE